MPDDIATERIPIPTISENNIEECMTFTDIYKELRIRGYHYTGLFRLLKSASISGEVGHIKWPANWVAFMDNMLQMKVLRFDSRSIYVSTEIRKVVIDPTYHKLHIHNTSAGEKSKSARIVTKLSLYKLFCCISYVPI